MDGILLLNKPKQMTSHDCVNKIRKIFNTKKVGHLGTLDPDVTGVLAICINDATKIIQFLDHSSKEYIAQVTLGFSTSTEDASGEIIEKNSDIKEISRDKLINVLNSFLGEQIQIPPMISSVKVNGKKLYTYARQNIAVERPERTINLYEIELLSPEEIFYGEEINFIIRVHSSKGTYIRTLAVDIGRKLGYPAHMSDLIRTKSGHFQLNQCFTFEEIIRGDYHLISIYDALKSYQMIEVDDNLKKRILNGQKLDYDMKEFTMVVFCDIFKRVLAVYEPDKTDSQLCRPVRVFTSE